MTGSIEGGCLCGRSRYRISGPLRVTAHCHCIMCRKGSGAPVVTWTVCRPEHFEWTGEKPAAYASSEGCARTFCAACGTKLTFTDTKRPDDVDITVGSLDDPNAVSPESQIFGPSKVSWLHLDPQVPFRDKHQPDDPPSDPVTDDERLEGGCLCGAVRYTVTGPPAKSGLCHCGICRRETGGPFVAWGVWLRERFEDNGAATTAYSTSEAGIRRFCPTCGATVYFESRRNPNIAEIMLAGLDNPNRVVPGAHAFAASALNGLVLMDDWPRWPNDLNVGNPDNTLLRLAF
ncbi:MAG: GFA family protein [Alphaproteobacteria bacterium]|nr:GFA family protein [Alphaproteobacteria bacterium]